MANTRPEKDEVHSVDLDSFVAGLDTGKVLDTECERLELDPSRNLQQHDVLKEMMESDRPALTARQVKTRLKSDSSRETVRRRLDELVELGILCVERYGNEKPYHVIDKRSDYAIPGDSDDISVPENVGLFDLLLFREPVLYDRLATTSIFLATYLVVLGALINPFVDQITIEAMNQFVEAGMILLLSVLLLLLVALIGVNAREVWGRFNSPL